MARYQFAPPVKSVRISPRQKGGVKRGKNVSRFDRYLLSQFMVLFGFFALVLVSIYWINQAVRLFDQLISDGQSAWVFLEFTALTLANVIRIVLPMAAFASAVYVTNRLSSESELVVMQATGFSPWRLARPVAVFGIVIGLMMSVLTHVLVPASLGQLNERKHDLQRDVTARLLTEGRFLHPTPGVTFYVREIGEDGTLHDMFLSDRRDPRTVQSYMSRTAYLIVGQSEDEGAKLVMRDGMGQTLIGDGQRLFTTYFDDLSYDVGRLFAGVNQLYVQARYLPTYRLLTQPAEIAELTGVSVGRVLEEAHGRFAQPLLCIAAALIGFATLLTGGYSRFGVWRQIVLAIVLLLIVKFVEGVALDPVRRDPDLWPLVYAPPAVGFVISTLMLALAGRGKPLFRFGRRRGDNGNDGNGSAGQAEATA